MRLLAAFAILIVTTAAAATAPQCPPKTSLSKGFRLRVHVTNRTYLDPDRDDYDGVELGYLELWPQPGDRDRNRVKVNGQEESKAAVFYFNGTDAEYAQGKTTLLTDAIHYTNPGQRQAPFGITPYIRNDTSTEYNVYFNLGSGVPGLAKLTPPSKPLSTLGPETFFLYPWCHNHYCVPTLMHVDTSKEPLRDHAVPFRLIPECAELPAITPNSESSHTHARISRCYDNVDTLNLSVFN